MLPKLQAEEALRTSTILAIGNGTMKKAEIRKTLKNWERIASSGTRNAIRPKSLAEMQAMGLPIAVVQSSK